MLPLNSPLVPNKNESINVPFGQIACCCNFIPGTIGDAHFVVNEFSNATELNPVDSARLRSLNI